MTTEKQYEVLNSLPPYGPMYIPISYDEEPFYSEGYVVKFKKSNGEEWVANFRPGWSNYNNVFDFPKHNTVVVFAGGQAYIINPNTEKPKFTFGLNINEVIQNENGSLICSDNLQILVLDNESGEIYISERISFDGIRNLNIKNNIITGQTFDPTNDNCPWSDFSLNLKTKKIEGGSFQEFLKRNNHIAVQSNGVLKEKKQSIVKNPWWKIW